MTNPNNCATCKYHGMRGEEITDEHCYMFQDAPTEQCMQHSGHDEELLMTSVAMMSTLAKGGACSQMRKVVDSLIAQHKS
jgi:hypothetical protein